MNDADFTRLKIITETELGRPIDADEEHELKLLYYFGKGCKLKAELEAASKPVHIKDILPAVMQDIENRQQQRRSGILRAVGDFLAGKSKRASQH